MKKLLPFLLLLTSLAAASAQHTHPGILCGNELFSKIIREKYPELQEAFDVAFEKASHQAVAADRSELTVKVVVHIVWKNPEENLHDSIILSQIQTLNEDFNRENADTANLRPLFQPVAGNAGIRFELAGVVRVQTSQVFALDLLAGTIFTELKSNATGGSDAWDTEKYLNIWVCKIQPTTIFGIPVGQILGVAFPPNGLDNWPAQSGAPTAGEDGVVIDFRAFGRNNPNPLVNPGGGGNLLINGRTPVHEVGHYFGLRHIWGDGGLLGPNNCDQSDGVDDTPFANAQSNFDCNTNKNTCTQTETFYNADVPDLIENYMDYSSETCMNMFTKGQVAIMRNVLMGPRSGLLSASSVATLPEEQAVRLFPNPVADRATLSFALSDQGAVSGRVVTAGGQTVLEIPEQVFPPGQQEISLDTRSWFPGLYFVTLQREEDVLTRKLFKQ